MSVTTTVGNYRGPLRALLRRFGGDTLAAVVLVAATLAALIWSNIGSSYTSFWGADLSVSFGGSTISRTLAEWISEGLMALFFFGIGLDVRREVTLGELRRPAAALLPVSAAVGGIVVPALIFLAINHGGPEATGWGSVVSTDTAFALGLLALIGPKKATRLRIFLLAFAVVDDIGALSIIAIFYSDNLQPMWLIPVVVGLGVIWWIARQGVWGSFAYIAVGVVVWFCTLQSGVHGTLAGVLIALLMPVHTTRMDDVDTAAGVTRLFWQTPHPRLAIRARRSINRAVPLNQRLSQVLGPYNQFLIVPLFALSNVGVSLSGDKLASAMTSTMTWGVVAGLVIGKFVGISTVSALVLKLSKIPAGRGLDLPRIMGVSGLGGIGFTISLLVIELGVGDRTLADEARIGVLLAALIAVAISWMTFAISNKVAPLPAPLGLTLPKDVDPSSDHIRGDRDAPLTLVIYADMGRVYRTRTSVVLKDVRRHVGERIAIVYRHNVNDEDLTPVALALEAASKQRKFWDLHDKVTACAELPDSDEFLQLADRAGLDSKKLRDDVMNLWGLSQVRSQTADASDAGLPNRPALFLNGQRIQGLINTVHVLRVIRQADDAVSRTVR